MAISLLALPAVADDRKSGEPADPIRKILSKTIDVEEKFSRRSLNGLMIG